MTTVRMRYKSSSMERISQETGLHSSQKLKHEMINTCCLMVHRLSPVYFTAVMQWPRKCWFISTSSDSDRSLPNKETGRPTRSHHRSSNTVCLLCTRLKLNATLVKFRQWNYKVSFRKRLVTLGVTWGERKPPTCKTRLVQKCILHQRTCISLQRLQEF